MKVTNEELFKLDSSNKIKEEEGIQTKTKEPKSSSNNCNNDCKI